MSVALTMGWPVANGTSSDNNGPLAVRLYLESVRGRAVVAAEGRQRATAAARRPLLWVAVTHTLGAVAAAAVLAPRLADHDPAAQMVAAVALGVAAACWAVWAWSAAAPLPAAVVGLALYGTLTAAGWAAMPDPVGATAVADATARVTALALTGAWVATTVGLLLRAVVAAVAARRAADPFVPRLGVMPSLALYGLLLAMLCLARAVGSHDAAGQLMLMRAMGLAVVVAVIVRWRAVWPAVAGPVAPSWLAAAVLCGVGTFAWSSVYADATAYLFGLPRVVVAEPMVVAGYGWAGAVAAVCLYPAVVEELAFRGLILPRLARAMTGGEAVFVSAAMFALLHLNLAAVPVLLPVGMVLGLLRRRSRSLWPCVLMHLTHNAAVLAAERWM